MVNKKSIISGIVLFLAAACIFAESQGEKLFKENKPAEAAVILEEEIKSGKASSNSYNFLGLSYYQLGEYEKSVEAFALGLKTSGTNKKILSFNQGNSYYALGNYKDAAKSFNLAFSADSTFTKALLNRANSNLMAQDYDAALSDYEKYIILCADDPQKEEIIAVIEALKKNKLRMEEEARLAAIEAERQAEEERRLAEEMERIRAEEARKAEEERLKREAEEAELRRIEEEKRAIEAERRRKLLEDVANSLHQTDSTNMSAGTEDLLDYDMEAELD